jgi:hypothetical protein
LRRRLEYLLPAERRRMMKRWGVRKRMRARKRR